MTKIKLEYSLPSYAVKYLESIKILFAVNSETKQSEAFVPLTLYLELLDKLENSASKQTQQQTTNGPNL